MNKVLFSVAPVRHENAEVLDGVHVGEPTSCTIFSRSHQTIHNSMKFFSIRKVFIPRCFFSLFVCILFGSSMPCHAEAPIDYESLKATFVTPPHASRPETWFHLIDGNVDRSFLTKDLEAIAEAGLQGIQLFHGKGQPWPGVHPQVQTLSPQWDGMIGHVADETKRLGLRFTMQNCPGWAMSGGPWITPENAMRHLIWSRTDLVAGQSQENSLPQPQPSQEDWRDYRDVAVVAFPQPLGDNGKRLIPVSVHSDNGSELWREVATDEAEKEIVIPSTSSPYRVEFDFGNEVTVRSIELPPVELLTKRMNFDPQAWITVQAWDGREYQTLVRHQVPRSTWQDRQPEHAYVLAIPDARTNKVRLIFETKHSLGIDRIRFSSAARSHDWRAQAAYALRSMERTDAPNQDPKTWIDPDTIIDITESMDSSGKLSWSPPSGTWTILRFGHVNTGAKNKPAPPEATGFECDKLSPAGADQHFAGYIGRISAPGGPADQGRLRGMLIDSWECYTQTWTPAMEAEFQVRRGYALRKWLPALAGWIVTSHRQSERFLRDWRATISDMLVDHYFGRMAELGRERGLTLSFETAIGDVSPGDILQYAGKADIPMCEFWQPNDPHIGGLESKPIRPTVSAAHIYGKQRVAAEAFTSSVHKWDTTPYDLKHLADRNFAMGVTHLVFHTYTHNPLDKVPGTSFGGGIGTPFVRGQTWWSSMPAFTQYLARCQAMLETGRPKADVLFYLGDDLDHKPRQDMPFPVGFQFDYCNADVLQNRLSVVDGRLQNPEGTSWSVLWLPESQCQRMTMESLVRLRELIIAGATVIGGRPTVNASLVGLDDPMHDKGESMDEAFFQQVASIWGNTQFPSGLRRFGKGAVCWGGTLEEQLERLNLRRDVTGLQSATWIHRQLDFGDLYFIAADRLSAIDANVCFRALGRPEFFDPMTGTISGVPVYDTDDVTTTVPIQLPAAGSLFVLFRRDNVEATDLASASGPRFDRITRGEVDWIDVHDSSRVDDAAPYPHFGLPMGAEIQPWVESAPLKGELINGGKSLLSFVDETYEFFRRNNQVASVDVVGTNRRIIDQGWSIEFPEGPRGKTTQPTDRLKAWTDLKDQALQAFSGTATYRVNITTDEPRNDQRTILDLGRVENIATVRVDGKPVATRWAPPFRFDVTSFLKAGENAIEIDVTNTWHNRLVYDGSQPEKERKTWTLAPPKSPSSYEPAGILGPVTLNIGQLVNIVPNALVADVSKPARVVISGETKQWHAVTLTIDGPQASELDVAPNPYLDYAFSVTFTHQSGSPTYTVPGYFAADGNAGQSSATSGNQWRAHLSPDKTGDWNYRIHFQRGTQVAIGGTGTPIDNLDGIEGTFHIDPSDKSGHDLRAHGRLQYVGEHYLQFVGAKEYFLKVGADSPETLLAYSDFDGTVSAKKAKKVPLKTWTPHIQDWRPGDPTWQADKGKGLIGAINYLADQGMNVFSFLVYNVNGDGDNVWPFVSRDDRMHYDCSKLDQWNIVFSHGTAKGMYLHFKLSEHENSGPIDDKPNPDALDGGDLGPERKLFIREMVARFSHQLALNWNLAEETTQTTEQLRQTAQYIHDLDPYSHLIVVHTTPSWPVHLKTYTPLLGDQSHLRGASVQTRDVMDTHRYVLHWVAESAKAGKSWVVPNDEQDLGALGTPPDPGYAGYKQTVGPTIHQIRKYALWATLMAGGAGIEYFFGMKHPENDVNCEDWRSREQTWRYARIAREWFVASGVPFWEMRNTNALVDNPQNDNSRYCFSKSKELYLVYFPEGGTTSLDLTGVDGKFTVAWFNPRIGGDTSKGSIAAVAGGKRVELGLAPRDRQEDWLVIVQRD